MRPHLALDEARKAEVKAQDELGTGSGVDTGPKDEAGNEGEAKVMGFNSVAVLYNDHSYRFGDPDLGTRIRDAMRGWSYRDRDPMVTNFGAGVVVSQAHADYSQVVVVGQNTGRPAIEAQGLDRTALDQMVTCLINHGYKVVAPGMKGKAK